MRPLSTELATRPMDPSSPASRSRCPNVQDVYWLPRSEWRTVAVVGRRCQVAIAYGVDDEFGADVVRDRPAHDSPGPDVDHGGAVDLPLGGGVFGDVGAPEPVRAVGDEPAPARSSCGAGSGPVPARCGGG